MAVGEDRGLLAAFSPASCPSLVGACHVGGSAVCSWDGEAAREGKPAVLIHPLSLGRWGSWVWTEFRMEPHLEIHNDE